jgi:outer membrane protein OmpA-like peptidoglycan-associated protein
MADMQRNQIGGVKELVVLVGILLTVVAGAIGTYWVQSQGVEAASTTTPAGKATEDAKGPRVAIPAPPAGLFHADVYFDFKSTRLRADAARVLQETARTMDLSNAWVVLVQGYTDRQGPAEYNRTLAQRRAESVKLFLVELGVPETAIRVVTMGKDGALCDEPEKECQQINRRVHLEFRKLAAAMPMPATVADTTTDNPAPTGTTSPAGDK